MVWGMPRAMAPVFRPSARCLVLDRDGRILLFRSNTDATDDAASRAWFTPGGGLRHGETQAQAASRELAEETGLRLQPRELGSVVAVSAGLWRAGQRQMFGADSFFLVRAVGLSVSSDGREEQERQALATHRWWSLSDLDATTEQVFPVGLASVLRQILTGGLPDRPVRLPWRDNAGQH